MKFLRYIDWSELSGLMVGAVLAVAICVSASILVYKLQHEGILGKEEYYLYSNLITGQGLHKGTNVQINGVDIGSVDSIALNENGLVRLKFILDIRYKDLITNKSIVYATRDQNIISERVVNIDISDKGDRILNDGDFIIAGTAQDIETVLKTANELVGSIKELVVMADTLLNLVMDTGSTIGMLLGSRSLYNRLDYAVGNLNGLLVDVSGLVTGVDGMFKTLNSGMPRAIAFADTMSIGVVGLMGNLDNLTNRASVLMNSLDTTMHGVSTIVNDLNSVVGKTSNLIIDGSQILNNTDDFMGGVSKFWFLRNKIPKKDSIPLLGDDTW